MQNGSWFLVQKNLELLHFYLLIHLFIYQLFIAKHNYILEGIKNNKEHCFINWNSLLKIEWNPFLLKSMLEIQPNPFLLSAYICKLLP